MTRFKLICAALLSAGALAGCGPDAAAPSVPAGPRAAPNPLGSLPADRLQPWERLGADGRIEVPRNASRYEPGALFLHGRERFLEGGDVTDNLEGSRIGAPDGEE